jgi:hypothetical protein
MRGKTTDMEKKTVEARFRDISDERRHRTTVLAQRRQRRPTLLHQQLSHSHALLIIHDSIKPEPEKK